MQLKFNALFWALLLMSYGKSRPERDRFDRYLTYFIKATLLQTIEFFLKTFKQ